MAAAAGEDTIVVFVWISTYSLCGVTHVAKTLSQGCSLAAGLVLISYCCIVIVGFTIRVIVELNLVGYIVELGLYITCVLIIKTDIIPLDD
jgi:hypothetical protein